MSKKVCIFDLDGVIVDTAKYHFMAWQKLADALGIEFTPEHNEALKGVSRVKSLEIILALGNVYASEEDKNLWLQQKNELYLSYIATMKEEEILPNVREILQYLKEKQHYIALGSASKNARLILEKVQLLSFFDVIVDGNDVANAKPDPEVFVRAAKLVHVPNHDAIVFEDSVAGIQAANIAGMVSIGIGEKNILKEAKFCFQNFTEMDDLFWNGLLN
jgi:beta-phosphoglucomutase